MLTTKRIQNMLDKVLGNTAAKPIDFEKSRSRILSLQGEDKVKAIREEFGTLISIDKDSLISGCYPPFEFWFEPSPPQDRSVYEEFKPYRDRLFIASGNHKTANFEYLINHGIEGYLNDINEAKKRFSSDSEKLDFLDKMALICHEITAWATAHADACLRQAKAECDKARQKELFEMADICRKVPLKPASSFREAVQSYFFGFMLFPDGLGRLDSYLYPFYKKDLEIGTITEQDAFELIENLFILIFSHLGKKHEKSGANHGVVAGYTSTGECGHNACTSLILKAVTELPTWRPQISYRYTEKTTKEQLLEAVEANIKRPDVVMFLNDEVIIKNLERLEIPFEDAIEYSVSGCNETVLTGCSQMGSIEGHVNLMYSLEKLMTAPKCLDGISSFEEFYSHLEERLKEDIGLIIRYSHTRDKQVSVNPSLMESLFTSGCIEKATPISLGGAKYNACTWCLTGLVNLADSLSVIKQTVFEDKILTLGELSQAIENDWEGYEQIRSYIVNKCKFFGNDNDADTLINRISESVCKIASEHTPFRGGKYIFGTLTGYEISHVVFGKNSIASPDGRHKGDAFAASICSTSETARKGVTAYLKSASKIDGSFLPSSVVVNLTLDTNSLDKEKTKSLLLSLLSSYFALGGVHLQINYLSSEILKDAKLHPEKYQSLRVRVTGFSGFFTTFEEKLQDEIINRSLYSV